MGKRIFLVDEDLDTVNHIEMVLTSEGYEVETAKSVDTIEGQISESPPDLIILNHTIGEVSGLTFVPG